MSEIAKFLTKNNLINETYTDYLVRQSKNGLRKEEKNFLVSVLLKDSEELKKIKVLKQDKIYEIFLKLSDHHFSVDNFFNEAIYDYFNKAFADNNEINIKGIEGYFKKIIFLQDTIDPQKIRLNLNSISRILYQKLAYPNEDHLFTKMKSYVLDSQISDSRADDANLLRIILDKNISRNSRFVLDHGIEDLLKRIHSISEETDKQFLERELLDLISKQIYHRDYKITRLFYDNNSNNLKSNRKQFYRTLWERGKIIFNKFTFLSILSILEDKKLNSYKDIYDKLDTKDAKDIIIKNLLTTKNVFLEANNDSQEESDILYLTSDVNSFKSIMEAYKNQEYAKDTKISFKLFNPHILWEELTNVASDISRNYYKEILDTLDNTFITEQLNKSSISLKDFEKLCEKYSNSFLNKINIESLESEKLKNLIQKLKKPVKRKNKHNKNELIKYINQHSKIDDIDKNFINRYSVDDLLSTKDSINNKGLYLDILIKRKSTVKLSNSNNNKIEKVITELKAKLSDTYNHERYFSQ